MGLGVELELHTARLAVNGFSREMARSQDTYLAVNASPGLLYRPALLEVLSQLPADRVIVEITEQRQFDSYVQLRETVRLVHDRGMRVAVDDTGSGFASLQRLVDVRPEIVKLDRALTAQIDSDARRGGPGHGHPPVCRRHGHHCRGRGYRARRAAHGVAGHRCRLRAGVSLGPARASSSRELRANLSIGKGEHRFSHTIYVMNSGPTSFVQAVHDSLVVFDGATGTNLQTSASARTTSAGRPSKAATSFCV